MTCRDRAVLSVGLRGPLSVLAGLSAVALVGCSSPPPAEEPTGDAADEAWGIAVGGHSLDQTVAHVYSLALNSREVPAVVEIREESSAQLAAGLGGGEEAEPGYDMVLARTMTLAQQLNPEGYAELTGAEDASGEEVGQDGEDQESSAGEDDEEADPGQGRSVPPAPTPEELLGVVTPQLDGAQLLEPTAGAFSSALVVTSVTAQEHGIDLSAEADDPAFAAACDELELGVREGLPDAEGPLAGFYDCEPAEITTGTEAELLDQVITAELDAAIITASHPGIQDHALVVLTDAERAFPQEQYVPVVTSAGAEAMPEVMEELAERLDDEALTTLRRLIDGGSGLSPDEAAEYWLVEEELIAEPEHWG